MTSLVALLAPLAATVAFATGVRVAFDPITGAWTELRCQQELVIEASQDVDIRWEGGHLPPVSRWRLVTRRSTGNGTVVVRRAGDWEIETTTVVRGTEVARSARFRWHGAGDVVVTGTALRTPVLRLGRVGRDRVLIPGNFPVRWRLVADLADGHRLGETGWTRGKYGIAIVHGPDVALSALAAYRFHHDQARVAAVRQGAGVVLEHSFDTVARLRPRDWLEVGEQVLAFSRGNAIATWHAVAALSNRLGNGPPVDMPPDLGRTVLYEVHPWGRLESWGDGDRGHRYDRLTRLLPYYKRLGVNALWLLPVSWPPPWVYTLPALDRVAPENGSPEQLRELVRSAHGLGMRVLIDLVTYGLHPDSAEVALLPEDVWCRDRKGQRARVWGGTVLAADTANPAWQTRIGKAVERWAEGYGFDGARLDCAGWGQSWNWAAIRPNASVAYGGLQLNRVVRDAFRRHNRDAVLLPEGGKPLVFRHADMIFDYPLYLALRDLTWAPNLQGSIADLQQWLEWERAAYPPRALKGLVRFLELHDTVPADQYFGVGPSQALMAALVFMEGVPLLQQEQEIGFSDDLAHWLHLRRSERCFTHGRTQYTTVRCSASGVLTFLREADDGAAVVAVNLRGEDITCSVRWPAELSARFPLAYDGLLRRRLPTFGSSVRVTVPAYRPVVVLLKRGSWRPASVPSFPTGHRWEVRTSEGVLRDVEQDYGTKLRPGETLEDALPTLRRARRAAEYGLMDGRLPPEVLSSPVSVGVNPWFVQVENRALRLTLARRHGGVPARLEVRKGARLSEVIGPEGDAYTDQGFFAAALYASADGETNPRLAIERAGAGVRVVFRGMLRQRAWNGVQSCPPASPPLAYTLAYTLEEGHALEVRLGLRSETERRAASSSFFALRVPVIGLKAWRRGVGAAYENSMPLSQRLGDRGEPEQPLYLRTEKADLIVRQGEGLARVFAIHTGNGLTQLFFALTDGPLPTLRPGSSVEARATLEVRPR